MTTRSLDDIRLAVRFRGDYRSSVRFPDTDVNREIQAAFGEFWELVADVNEGYWDTTAAGATVVGQGYVALPADHWRLRGLDRLDGDHYRELRQIGVSERNRYRTTNARPEAYRLTARGADLYPTPDAVYTLRFTYTPSAPVLGSAREFYSDWDEYVIYATMIRLAEAGERDTSEWQARIDRQVMRIKGAASGRRSQTPEMLVLHDGGGFDNGGMDGW